MKLSDVFEQGLKKALEENCELIEQKVHTNDSGIIQSIELKYVPKELVEKKSNEAHIKRF